jgi:cytoskeleton protein RodZ
MLAITGAVAAVIALAVILPLVLSSRGDGDRTAGSAPTAAQTTSTSPPSSPSPAPSATTTAPPPVTTSPPPPPTSAKPPPNAPTLLVRADRGDSWLTVRDAHGRRVFDALLRDGAKRTFDGPYYSVVVGDAASVDIVVNGQHRPRGKRGAVLRFTVRA